MATKQIDISEHEAGCPNEAEALDSHIKERDREADKVIAAWSLGSLAANLLPPPFDTMAVSVAFVRMGQKLARVYGIDVSVGELKPLAKAMMKGIMGVALAAHIGTGIFKYVPGVNIWVALLIQPPIVAAIAYSVGAAFKSYYRVLATEGRALSPEELQKLTTEALRARIG